jgi:uncharacterized membrane protein
MFSLRITNRWNRKRNVVALPRLYVENKYIELQDRQCTYNVILGRVRVTIVAVDKQKYNILYVCVCVFVCSLSYPSCKARRRIIFSSVAIRLFSIFPHYLINCLIFEKKS